MTKEKTIRQWLETLPDGYRERALKNMDKEHADNPVESLASALGHAFYWAESPEGHTFWGDVCDWAKNSLPELPEDKND